MILSNYLKILNMVIFPQNTYDTINLHPNGNDMNNFTPKLIIWSIFLKMLMIEPQIWDVHAFLQPLNCLFKSSPG